MSKKIETILNAARTAMGGSANHFVIEHSDTLVDDDDLFSALISFAPRKDIPIEDGRVDGKTQHLEFIVADDGDIMLIIEEDTEIDATKENIFACLYWGEVVRDV